MVYESSKIHTEGNRWWSLWMEINLRIFRYAEGSDRDVSIEEMEKGIKINGKYINNIQYADDTVLIADFTEALQLILDRVNEAVIWYEFNIDEKKTKWMIISRDPGQNTKIIVINKEIEKVKEFWYLGCIITENLSPEFEVK